MFRVIALTAISVRLEQLGVSDKPLFQIFFLKNDRDQSVRVEEVEEIDCEEIKSHIERGDSIFISQVRKNQNYVKNRAQYKRREVVS